MEVWIGDMTQKEGTRKQWGIERKTDGKSKKCNIPFSFVALVIHELIIHGSFNPARANLNSSQTVGMKYVEP